MHIFFRYKHHVKFYIFIAHAMIVGWMQKLPRLVSKNIYLSPAVLIDQENISKKKNRNTNTSGRDFIGGMSL